MEKINDILKEGTVLRWKGDEFMKVFPDRLFYVHDIDTSKDEVCYQISPFYGGRITRVIGYPVEEKWEILTLDKKDVERILYMCGIFYKHLEVNTVFNKICASESIDKLNDVIKSLKDRNRKLRNRLKKYDMLFESD